MNHKALAFRALAWSDFIAATRFCLDEMGDEAAVKFVNAVEKTLASVRRQPKIGSPQYAHQLAIAGLRTRAVRPYPFLILYVERAASIEIWRLLHVRRDIPKAIAESDPDEME